MHPGPQDSPDKFERAHGRMGLPHHEAVEILINGRPVLACAGETVATALLAAGVRRFRRTHKTGAPRGLYCGMGVCFECLVTVDGVANVQACLTPVTPGMRIETELG